MVNAKHNSASSSSLAHKNSAHQRHSQILPDLNEHQMGKLENLIRNVCYLMFNLNFDILASHMPSNEADLYDMECMSPLYATPPHSPSSELSSPGQLPSINNIDDGAGASALNGGSSSGASCSGSKSVLPDNHFARDTHMRIILGNLKENQASSSRYVFEI